MPIDPDRIIDRLLAAYPNMRMAAKPSLYAQASIFMATWVAEGNHNVIATCKWPAERTPGWSEKAYEDADLAITLKIEQEGPPREWLE